MQRSAMVTLEAARRLTPEAARARWQQWNAELADEVDKAAGGDTAREAVAQEICHDIVLRLWDRSTDGDDRWLPVVSLQGSPAPGASASTGTEKAVDALAALPLVEASYRVGLLYTALLPAEVRSSRGAYYTPPVLAERLLSLAEAEGVDWATASVLDPACGGGAFLLPVAERILETEPIGRAPAEEQLHHLESHLRGIEIDAFAAWMTRSFLQLLVHLQSCRAQRSLEVQIDCGDALEEALQAEPSFDLVVGNPPYGRVSLSDGQRRSYERSLFGHANLYGLFLDAALRWRKTSGLVAFLTPTSFLGGQYFKRLRALLLREAPPRVIDVVADRTGVFPSVQQETCLAVFGPNGKRRTAVHLVQPDVGGQQLRICRAGRFGLGDGDDGASWLLPRTPSQAAVIRHAAAMRTRLHTLGYRASTGPVVWNRHKDQLRSAPGTGVFPLIWAEAVRPNEFRFEYRVRADQGFMLVRPGQSHLLIDRPCVLLQRTTAKEQRRRLVACAVPRSFLEWWGSMAVENHVNVLWGSGEVSPVALAAVLNTEAVDLVFRCLSGSVAVSATELHCLPLPSREIFERVEELVDGSVEAEAIERVVGEAYGVA